MNDTPMRAAFEAWWLREYGETPTRSPWENQSDTYLMSAVATAWRAWQAGVVWLNG